MSLSKYVKAASERKRYQIDYTNWLDIGELVVTVIFAVQNNTIVNPLVVDGVGNTIGNLGVQFYVAGGVDGVTYTVLATMTSNSAESQIKLDTVLYFIKEP